MPVLSSLKYADIEEVRKEGMHRRQGRLPRPAASTDVDDGVPNSYHGG